MIQSLTQWTADMNIPCMVEAMLIMSWESQVVRAWMNIFLCSPRGRNKKIFLNDFFGTIGIIGNFTHTF